MATAGGQSDEQTLKELRAFRPSARPMAITVAANVVLAALCLGVPSYRGKVQSQESLQAFSGFAACMLGGKPRGGTGLGLPPGEHVHFAANVMGAPADWPERCNGKLDAIAPEEAIFLWPSVKQAGADLRAVVALLRTELGQVARQRASGKQARVPERPLLALSKLRAALTLMAQATNMHEGLDASALTFEAPPALTQPARLPIYAGATAALDVWLGQDGLEALAMDRRGISWLRVESGKVDRERVKRTSLVRATVRHGDQPYVVWAMPPKKCEQAEDRCVRRASGLARFDKGAAELPRPIWLGGHPAGRADRSLRIGLEEQADLLARSTPEGELEVRRYKLEQSEQEDAPPLSPTQRWPLPDAARPTDALLLPRQPPALLYAESGPAGTYYRLWEYTGEAPPELLVRDVGLEGWLASCPAQDRTWLLLGTEKALQIMAIGPDATRTEPQRVELALDNPLHVSDPAGDRLRLLCSDEQIDLLGIARDRSLAHLRCGPEACETLPPIARNVGHFDAAPRKGGLLVAYTRGTEPLILVARVNTAGAVEGEPASPAACWDPTRGMCGAPTLVSDGTRILLGARDGSDLLAIESEDGGKQWKTMSGLKVSTAISTDVSAPMDQHRIRKGLEHR